jgi:predicted TPR repeat methyltransferase
MVEMGSALASRLQLAIPVAAADPLAMALSAAEATALLAEAARHEDAGDWGAAGAACLRILAGDPHHAEAQYRLGRVNIARGQPHAALGLLRQATRACPENSAYHGALGEALLRTGAAAEAAASLAKALELEPRRADLAPLLGEALRRAETVAPHAHPAPSRAVPQPVKADAPALDGEEAPFEAVIGMVTEATLGSAGRVLAKDPAAESDFLDWAKFFVRTGDVARAVELYETLLHVDPENPLAVHMLAAAKGEHGRPRAADAYIMGLFDDYAGRFDQNLADLNYQGPQLAAALIGRLAPAALDIADLGCGTGLCGPLLRPYARRLVGVDLSPRMLGKARERGVYDALLEAEITRFLAACEERFDLVVAIDVLIYFGRLEAPLAAMARVLRPRGLLVFTLERLSEGDPAGEIKLNLHGRYSHAEAHVAAVLAGVGLEVAALEHVILRKEVGAPVDGILVAARQPSAGHG